MIIKLRFEKNEFIVITQVTLMKIEKDDTVIFTEINDDIYIYQNDRIEYICLMLDDGQIIHEEQWRRK